MRLQGIYTREFHVVICLEAGNHGQFSKERWHWGYGKPEGKERQVSEQPDVESIGGDQKKKILPNQ